ncbi:MarR family winged helix-turn-helix transcriptional regulator [Mycolicibacterium fortuitum]|uniref:MarR family transcriptional regulator n=2 Tax=Mycolicibacterium fortuitum TaxID=1766 RepID=A0AAE4VGF9_MYCFO|nr:MarR family transcriptional regulator [Mycolicibacterium fortuitum]MCA4726617.1 MarR family transcriptional regulator [Mycolicibacterium fortuitum]MCV7141920.1 MarR family transcriptional regulator [Mycolicibacterium fortuitum]MDV7193820.1 MarR family transcriptional regulator [Mycolicibacterium fortuitum]MDV7209013.1 MarR family transcriptional regulator [Mycolicibacterium fortuitum]MDV7228921.1 MarR family transcriptional regulator [Mycolicibacterium fortuitum]
MVDVERGPGYLVKRVQQSLRRNCDAALRPTGLSMAQYTALRALADHPQASAAELARLCFVTRQSLQDVLTGLRAEGLVEESSATQRGRARALQLTAAGKRRLSGAHAAVLGVENTMLNGMSGKAQRELASLLLLCAENLEAASSETTIDR